MSVTTVIDTRQNTWAQNTWYIEGDWPSDSPCEIWVAVHAGETNPGKIRWLNPERTHCTVESLDHPADPHLHDLMCLDSKWLCDCATRNGHCWHRMVAEFARTNILIRRERPESRYEQIDKEIPNGEPFTGIYEGLCGKGHTCLD